MCDGQQDEPITNEECNQGVGSNENNSGFWTTLGQFTHEFLPINCYFQPFVVHILHHDIPYDIQLCLQLQ